MNIEPDDGLHDGDPNISLDVLLKRLNVLLDESNNDYGGQPLFLVEAKLLARLEVSLPGARFSAADIRGWAAEISS